MLFRSRKKPPADPFDLEKQQPAVRRSICTGEMTAGYIDRATGKFHELLMVPDQRALEEYFKSRGVSPENVRTIY